MPHTIGLLEYSIAILVLIALGSFFYFRKPTKKDTEDSKQSDQSSLAPYKVEAPETPLVVTAAPGSNVTLGDNTVSVVTEEVKVEVTPTPTPKPKNPVQKASVKPAAKVSGKAPAKTSRKTTAKPAAKTKQTKIAKTPTPTK